MCHHLPSDDTQDLQVWSRSGLKNTGFCGHLTCWHRDSCSLFFLANVRTKSDKPVWQVNWVQPFLSSLLLNSCHLLYGRYCKFMQYPLQSLLINLMVLRSQKVENYISQTPLQVRGPKWTCSGLDRQKWSVCGGGHVQEIRCSGQWGCKTFVLLGQWVLKFSDVPGPTVISLLFLAALLLFVVSEPNSLALLGMIWISSDCLLQV